MKSWSGDPRAITTFHFGKRRYDRATGEARLGYLLGSGDDEFVERVVFPNAPWPTDPKRQIAFERALEILHLVAGVSYYKAILAPEILYDEGAPDQSLAGFLNRLYIEGLAEFGYVNQVQLEGRIHFPATSDQHPSPEPLHLSGRALVALGGGKDSLVGLDLMRRANVEVTPVCVGQSDLIGQTALAAGMPLLRVNRGLDPKLQALNAAGAWNGHVPVTAINSAILVCAAILYGYRYVVFSNERSADEATLVTVEGKTINHQYSKTSAFEGAFREIVHSHVSPDLEYFSVLRPFSELEIVRRFSELTRFHSVYSSCNRNFHLGGSRIAERWCGDCPKCRFAALSLAVFLDPIEVTRIQGRDLLDDPAQTDGFRALCGLGFDKPFECVGETGESRAALLALTGRPRWAAHSVVQALRKEVEKAPVPSMEELLKPSAKHFIPPEIVQALPGEFG